MFYNGRTLDEAAKPVYESKSLRRNMQLAYKDLANYVLAMSKVPNSHVQFDTVLNILNAERKYYSNLLAQRRPSKE